jgi:hypothetical protein
LSLDLAFVDLDRVRGILSVEPCSAATTAAVKGSLRTGAGI